MEKSGLTQVAYCHEHDINPHIFNLFDVMNLEPSYDVNQRHPDYVVTVIVPANKMLPSARSTYK